MRIEAYNAVGQVYQTNSKVAKANEVSKTNDKFEISETAKTYQTAKKAVSAAPEVREDKVAEIKAKMSSGNYTVKPEDFAEKIINSSLTIKF